MRVALLHLRDERPEEPEFQAVLDALTQGTLDAVTRLGWEPDLVASAQLPIEASVERALGADLVVILGGEDVDPSFYGGEAGYPGEGSHEPQADAAHIAVIRAAIAARKPLLGICRGLQLVNVALGGTLIQHLDPGGLHRANAAGMGSFVASQPALVAGSGLPQEALEGFVYCTHHQAVDALGAGLRIEAWAEDGVVEAVVHESAPLVAVQWHPEHPETSRRQLVALLLHVQSLGDRGVVEEPDAVAAA